MKVEILNKFIIEQLKKIKIDMPYWNENTTHIIIPRQSSNQKVDFVVGSTYNITIKNYIIDQPPNFTLSENWNYGTTPPEVNLYAEVLQIMGNMLKCRCRGITTQIEWEGWLPRKSITIN